MLNLAVICERYGGGGHARVGAISFPPDRSDDAREAAAEIVAELRAHDPLAGETPENAAEANASSHNAG